MNEKENAKRQKEIKYKTLNYSSSYNIDTS